MNISYWEGPAHCARQLSRLIIRRGEHRAWGQAGGHVQALPATCLPLNASLGPCPLTSGMGNKPQAADWAWKVACAEGQGNPRHGSLETRPLPWAIFFQLRWAKLFLSRNVRTESCLLEPNKHRADHTTCLPSFGAGKAATAPEPSGPGDARRDRGAVS